jgi:hypothetical protein
MPWNYRNDFHALLHIVNWYVNDKTIGIAIANKFNCYLNAPIYTYIYVTP